MIVWLLDKRSWFINPMTSELCKLNSCCCFLFVLLISCFQASHLETETISYEEKEQQLVNDCVKELRECWTQCSRCVDKIKGKGRLYESDSPLSPSFNASRQFQPADIVLVWGAGQEDRRCFQTTGGDHSPSLADCGPAEESKAGMKTSSRPI